MEASTIRQVGPASCDSMTNRHIPSRREGTIDLRLIAPQMTDMAAEGDISLRGRRLYGAVLALFVSHVRGIACGSTPLAWRAPFPKPSLRKWVLMPVQTVPGLVDSPPTPESPSALVEERPQGAKVLSWAGRVLRPLSSRASSRAAVEADPLLAFALEDEAEPNAAAPVAEVRRSRPKR